jgi:site-specific DNA-methyltransferase (adenine-specific)
MQDEPEQVIGAQSVGRVVLADNLTVLRALPDDCLDLVYIDPPFNTGKRQVLQRLKTTRAEDGDRVGFQGQRYRTVKLGESSYVDIHDDYLTFLEERLVEIRRVLKQSGSLYVHVDYREVHYCKVLIDAIFGRDCFLNEVIWAYDYGARTRKRWPPKHDTILVYVKDAERYFFDAEAVERIPYLAPGLVGAEKAARGKLPTDTWWHTIVPPAGKERTGYPTQKPLGILRRIVQASSPPGGLVADFFAGSGTTGAACIKLGRRFLLVDSNPEAVRVMAERFAATTGIEYVGEPALTLQPGTPALTTLPWGPSIPTAPQPPLPQAGEGE